MIPPKLRNWLEKAKIKYEPIAHKTVYTAFDLARTARAKLEEVGKSLLVKVDDKYVVMVVPSHYKLDMAKIKKSLKAKKVEIARERIMKDKLRLQPGTMTPFTAIYPKLEKVSARAKKEAEHIPVYIDRALVRSKQLLIADGSFQDSIRLKTKDFLEHVEATSGNYAVRDLRKKIQKAVKKTGKKIKKLEKKARKTAKKVRRSRR